MSLVKVTVKLEKPRYIYQNTLKATPTTYEGKMSGLTPAYKAQL